MPKGSSLDFGYKIHLIGGGYSDPFARSCRGGSIEYGLDKRRLFNTFMLPYKLLCQLGHIIQQIQWYLKYNWQMRLIFGAFGQLHQVNHSTDPQDFGAKLHHPLWITTLLLRKCFWPITRSQYRQTLDHGPLSYPAT